MSRPLEEAIKEELKTEAGSIRFTEEQSSKVLNKIHNQNRRKITKMGNGKRILIAAAAIVVMGTITVLGAGKVVGWNSVVNKKEVDYKNAQAVLKAEDKLGAVPKVPQQFLNGIAFDSGYLTLVDGVDENDNIVESYPEVVVNYDKEVSLDIIPIGANGTDTELPAELSRQIGDISMNAYAVDFLFLPPDASPTAEDLALEEAGKLQISYGTETEERQTFRQVTWTENGLAYSLHTFNVDFELEELLNMAEEVLAAE